MILALWCQSAPSNAQANRLIPPPRSELAASNWSVNASPNLAHNPPSKRVVEAFVGSIEIAVWGESYIGEGEEICSFRFADLRHSGFVSLVYGKGVTDRPSCRDVYIIDRTASGFEMYWGGGDIGAGGDVSGGIMDLRHDGNLELLLGDSLGSIPHRCIANWTVVYAWTGANYTNVSDRFRDFYRERLDDINRIIPALQPVRGANGYARSDKECLEAEAAMIQRFLGISSDAGMDQALRLATSTDPGELEFAAELLFWIGSPKAREYLAKLASHDDQTAATFAKNALSTSAPRKNHGGDFTPVAVSQRYP
jgi:hypothetical protein